jgi:5-methylcytosine-specific restriction endonuclease McrA
MNSCKTSSGDYVLKSVLDRNVRKAKAKKLADQLEEHGYNFCQSCGRSRGDYLDCAHLTSVDQCQKQGMSELAWDVDNINILCRACHAAYDTNVLMFTKKG